jgi:hypothetical protein
MIQPKLSQYYLISVKRGEGGESCFQHASLLLP